MPTRRPMPGMTPQERSTRAHERQADALERIAFTLHRWMRKQGHDFTDAERRELFASLTSAQVASEKTRKKLEAVLAQHPVAAPAADHTTTEGAPQ